MAALILGSLVYAYVLTTYYQSAPTQNQNLDLFADVQRTIEISSSGFNWGNQERVISNDTNILCWAFNSGNVPLNVTIASRDHVNAVVTYSPTDFVIAPGGVKEISMSFSQVVSNTIAEWSFDLLVT